jgi:hypothetical protein
MGKISKYHREQITRAVLTHRFGAAALVLVNDRAALAAAIYDDLYPAAVRRKMKALPAGWLPFEEGITIQFGDSSRNYETLPFNGAVYGSASRVLEDPLERVSKLVGYSHSRNCAKVYETGHAFCETYQALKARRVELEREIEAASRQTESAIASVSTFGKLLEMWPEIAPFAAPYDNEPAPLPALPTATLNTLLRLPVSEAA